MLSVIVPVYRVEEFLPQCLDSLLGEPIGVDLEVIAVDDASPDGSGQILARYAAADARLRVVMLAHNVGLGAARNAGLASASGDYVWFVDSDDWLPEGTLDAVAARIEATTPDVLVLDYERIYPDGHADLRSASELVPPGLPDVFTLHEAPALLRSLTNAWNKVVRREFLTAHELTFGSGWYEDISFTLPLQLSAGKISVLDRVCYHYRQRPGAITATVSARHFEVFPHWERVFAFLDAHRDCDDLRPLVFGRMIWHLLTVLGHAERVPADRRRDFFAEMTALYRRHRPAGGYSVPGGAEGLKERLVGLGAYRTFETLRRVDRLRKSLRRRGGPVGSATAVH